MTEKTPATEARQGPTSSEEHRAAGHWLLAKLGKRVLRPGGIELTRKLLANLDVRTEDRLVELGPGMGRTAELLLAGTYATYTGIEPDAEARERLAAVMNGHHDAEVREGDARATNLPDGSADVVVSEAMMTMHSNEDKAQMAEEVWRVLAPGGRWAIHELSLRPDDIDPAISDDLRKALSRTIKVGARPLTNHDWQQLLTDRGFDIAWIGHNDMRLVDPSRIVVDEGLLGALRFFRNLRRNPEARTRVRAMRNLFREHRDHLAAIAVVAVKPAE